MANIAQPAPKSHRKAVAVFVISALIILGSIVLALFGLALPKPMTQALIVIAGFTMVGAAITLV